jgi:hypothetical protein
MVLTGGGLAMSDLNFDPIVGEEVRVLGRPGLYKVVRVYMKSSRVWRTKGDVGPPSPPLKLIFVDLKSEESGEVLTDVPSNSEKLEFDETHPVRCVLEWLKQDESFRYPSGITGFRVDSEERFDGEPQFVVRFLVDSAAQPTRERVQEWNEFTSRIRERILTSLNLDRWVQVMLQQEQEAVHATL